MVQVYYEAADRISQLADEFGECDEVCQILRAGSARIAKLAGSHGGIIKIASATEEDTTEDTTEEEDK